MPKKLPLPRANWQNTNADESELLTMGKTKGLNKAEFEVGSEVRIADRAFSRVFSKPGSTTTSSSPSSSNTPAASAKVKDVTFFHGGDEIYTLEGIPGVWHEECLSCRLKLCQHSTGDNHGCRRHHAPDGRKHF